MSIRRAFPILDRPHKAKFEFQGFIGDRIAANQKNWLLLAPAANPGILNMFCNRAPSDQSLLPWSGEFAGKYLISAVQSFRITQDEQLKETINQFVSRLISCQESNGYLGPFSSLVSPGHPPEQWHWDLWGHYHCMLGLYLWYRENSDENALAACIKAANLICNTYKDTGLLVISQCDWIMVNEACIHILTLLFEDSNQKIDPSRQIYSQMIQKIQDEWPVSVPMPNCGSVGDYVNYFQEPNMFYTLRRPRWETLHIVQAIGELYYITGDEKYAKAFKNIWGSIIGGDRHNTGGFSSGEQATGSPYDPRSIETCATIAWMAVTVDMLRLSADSRAVDELELSTWNAVLGAQYEDGSWWTYNTPMGGIPTDGIDTIAPLGASLLGERRPSTFDIGWQAREGTPQLSCCAANGPRGLGIISEWAVMIANDGIALNYYGPYVFSVKLIASGKNVQLEQITDYPLKGKVALTIRPESAESFVLRLRIPEWSKKTDVKINGKPYTGPIKQGTYLLLNRVWRPGDMVEIQLDMSLRFWIGDVPPENSEGEGSASGKVSVYYGPFLLAYDPRFDIHAANQLPFVDLNSTGRLRTQVGSSSDDKNSRPLLLIQLDTLDHGPITLCDFASAGKKGMPYVSWLPIIDKVWQFGRLDGYVIATRLRLLQDKRIVGTSPTPNEDRWQFEGDTLVFYKVVSDGNNTRLVPSTRFTRVMSVNGRMVLQGEFLFDRSITHVLMEMDWGITNKKWIFTRQHANSSNHEVIACGIRLHADGTIEGYSHVNESKWGLEDEGQTLVFYLLDERLNKLVPSTKFDLLRTTVNERFLNDLTLACPPGLQFKDLPFNGLLLQGKFLLDPSADFTHFLIEMGPSWVPIQPYVSFKIAGLSLPDVQ
jgi:DUF1680 family protein